MTKEMKQRVQEFWSDASCGERLYLHGEDINSYAAQAESRYKLEPYILSFAEFEKWKDQKVLEIGVGLGADHELFCRNGADTYGIDLTIRAVEHTNNRLNALGLKSNIKQGDAENLDFLDETFDCVYSWGVLHHSPDTQRAVNEVFRVLKRGGIANVMIYQKWSLVGIMLWIRYALLRGKPFLSLDYIYSNYLESPGTKAYSKSEALEMFNSFSEVKINSVLSHGDLLASGAGQRHDGVYLKLARLIWPRKLIKLLLPNSGLFLLIKAKK